MKQKIQTDSFLKIIIFTNHPLSFLFFIFKIYIIKN